MEKNIGTYEIINDYKVVSNSKVFIDGTEYQYVLIPVTELNKNLDEDYRHGELPLMVIYINPSSYDNFKKYFKFNSRRNWYESIQMQDI